MYKFIAVVAILVLAACGSSASDTNSGADSTNVGGTTTIAADTVRADSSVVAPTVGDTAK